MLKSTVKLLASAFSLSLLAGAAHAAAPMTSPSSQANWTGIYAGVNGGYGSAHVSTTDIITNNGLGADGVYPNSGNLDGVLGGATIGANYQSGHVVFGAEGDWDRTNQTLAKSVSCTGGCVATGHSKIRWLATLRGRIGYAINNVLLYGTGGAAFVSAKDTQTQTVPVGAPAVVFRDTALGWTVGAGTEYAISKNLSAKFEYLYVHANLSQTVPFPAVMGGGFESENVSLADNLVRVGLNYRF